MSVCTWVNARRKTSNNIPFKRPPELKRIAEAIRSSSQFSLKSPFTTSIVAPRGSIRELPCVKTVLAPPDSAPDSGRLARLFV
jgi:hypothetical protein